MSDLEQIIRPFLVDGRVSPPQQYFEAGQIGVPPVVLRFGRAGQGKILNGSINYNQTFYVTQYFAEKALVAF